MGFLINQGVKNLFSVDQQRYSLFMKNYKNYLISLLTGLLLLSLSTQPSQGAGASAAAKAIEYDRCINFYTQEKVALDFYDGYPEAFKFYLSMCKIYKP